MLDGSVFQGVLLMSEPNFRQLFPSVEGYRYFLIEVPGPAADADRLSALLETQLTPYGFEARARLHRLANFLAVQNTYLSTFQTLEGWDSYWAHWGWRPLWSVTCWSAAASWRC